MVLATSVKLSKSPNSATLYLAIPADIAKDSQFPFYPNEVVDLEIKPDGTMVISGIVAQAKYVTNKLDEKRKRK